MSRRARVGLLIAVAAVVVVGAVAQVLTNYATAGDAPAWLAVDPVRLWLILLVVVLVVVIATLVGARVDPVSTATGDERAAPRNMGPRFVVAPSSLRAPYVDAAAVHGRGEELAHLRNALGRPGSSKLIVVAGPGGMGKTLLTSAACREASEDGRTVFWVRWEPGDSTEVLAARMVEAATSTGLVQQRVQAAQRAGASLADLVWDHLERIPGWLLVLDNFDNARAFASDAGPIAEYRSWLRPSAAGAVIVTSRDRDPTTWGPAAEVVRLGPLAEHAAAGLLLHTAPQAGGEEEARALARRLGGLPLALQAAGAVLAAPTTGLSQFTDYRQALDCREVSVLPELTSSPEATEPHIARSLVGHTWELSLDQMATAGLALARPLLRLLALLAEAPVPRSVLTPGLLARVTGEVRVTVASVEGALAGLERYGLVEVPDRQRTHEIVTIALHPLVRETSLLLLEQAADPTQWREARDARLIDAVTETEQAGRAGWDTARLLTPHLQNLAGLESDDLESFEAARRAIDNLADVLDRAGAHAAERALRETVLHAEQRLLGDEHPNTLASRNNLATALAQSGEIKRAVDLLEQTVAIRVRVLGEEHLDTLISCNNLALVLHESGELSRAIELHEQTLTALIEVLGDEHPDTLLSRNNLANALRDAGESTRAVELHEQTLAVRVRTLGDEHPDTLVSRSNLAGSRRMGGELSGVVELQEQTLAARVRVLGEEHPDTLVNRNNLALALHESGELGRAVELHEQTLAALTRVLGEKHPDTLASRNNLANALRDAGEVARAVKLHEETLAARVRVLGEEHPDTVASRQNLDVARVARDHASSAGRRRFWFGPLR